MEIKVYGTSSSGHQLVMNSVSHLLRKANISFKMTEEKDLTKFLEKGIESIPALQMNDNSIVGLKSSGSFSKSLRNAVNEILSTENYGDLSKFIIPVDFSDASINALSYGHRLATDLDAITKVIHVYKPKPTLDPNRNLEVISQEQRNKKLDDLVLSIDKDWGSDILKASFVSSEFRVGFPVEGILSSVEENKGEMIIMGTTGSDNIMKKWYGSVSIDVAAQATCPTLLVPMQAKYSNCKKALLAIDENGIANHKLKTLFKICTQFNTELHIIHVSKSDENKNKIELITEENPKLTIKSTVLQSKDIASTINQYAVENKIDIIALSPRSKSIFSHFLNGSLTKEMAMYSSIPLLLLK